MVEEEVEPRREEERAPRELTAVLAFAPSEFEEVLGVACFEIIIYFFFVFRTKFEQNRFHCSWRQRNQRSSVRERLTL